MKIVRIFGEKLFAFHYDNEDENELNRLLGLWSDVGYLYHFLKDNKQDTGSLPNGKLIEQIITDAEYINDFLEKLSNNENEKLEYFFKPLYNSEYQSRELSLQKGRKSYLRVYALKIDKNCFVITGGAIKFNHLMEDRTHTDNELHKLESAKQFLKEQGVYDSDSFYEFLFDIPL